MNQNLKKISNTLFNLTRDTCPVQKHYFSVRSVISVPVTRKNSLLFVERNYFENNMKRCFSIIKMLKTKQHQINLQCIPRRNIFQGPLEDRKPLPKLLYIQNPFVWLSNKLDFRFLRYTWDPNFTEEEFSRGARQAVSTVTMMVSKNMFENMRPLLTKNALLNLRRDVEILWADEVRRNIGLNPEDVQLIIPRKIHFRQSSALDHLKFLERGTHPALVTFSPPSKPMPDKKFCDIDVLFIGMKWLEEQSLNTPIVFVDIVSRFHRNYTEGLPPDWTISAFKVRRFSLIPQKS